MRFSVVLDCVIAVLGAVGIVLCLIDVRPYSAFPWIGILIPVLVLVASVLFLRVRRFAMAMAIVNAIVFVILVKRLAAAPSLLVILMLLVFALPFLLNAVVFWTMRRKP